MERFAPREAESPPAGTAHPEIIATPFAWHDPATMPRRPYILGRLLLRGTVASAVAPGGVGKSAFMASTALALTSRRPILGEQVWDRAQRVWYWNLEDDATELDRVLLAASLHHGVSAEDCADRLFVDSGLDGQGLCTATEDANGFKIIEPVYEALAAELERRDIDVLIVDPFVSSHQVSENDNTKIDAIAKRWGRLASHCQCAIVLVHHSRKLAGQAVTAEASRGAVALINAARSVLVFNRMTAEEADRFGINDDAERRRHFTVQDDKHNRAPPEKAKWFRIASVPLGNGDDIGVVEPWAPPDAFDGIDHTVLRAVQARVADGEWRASSQSTSWVGIAIADVLGADLENSTDKTRVKALAKGWIQSDVLRVVEGKDEKSNMRKFVRVGIHVDSPAKGAE
ncbi:AAA family ATPase [Sphingosinicella sp.]|uniref:AAA family ATPase n=1 Tax=Sphingosinicella sp. TaxID=1917971 RepID=UPI00180F227F|nr:AAA family ATPase [Sphingosinicella sp.]MBA4757742.1 AAA family ATPase [Sphingosinicella sp.]